MMTNLRKLPRNFLIQEIRKRDKAIALYCFDCLCGAKQKDCKDTGCFLFTFRPWSKKELKPINFQKK